MLPAIQAAVLAVGGGSLAYAGLRSDVTLAVDGQAGQVVKDEGDGGTKVAEFLASQKFV